MNEGYRKRIKNSPNNEFSHEEHRQRIIKEAVKKFKSERSEMLMNLRNIPSKHLESIAVDILDRVRNSFGDEIGSVRPKPLVDEDDEMLQTSQYQDHESLMIHIIEYLEAELYREENDQVIDCIDYFVDGDISIEEYNDDGNYLVCPFCKIRTMNIDNGSSTCQCNTNIIDITKFGGVNDIKLALAAVFDRHFLHCSQRYKNEKMSMYEDGIDEEKPFVEALNFKLENGCLEASCSRCGFIEIMS